MSNSLEQNRTWKDFGLPPPQLSPAERSRRRLAFRNERSLHKRTCDKTGKPIISVYRTDSPHIVYCLSAWWADDWDGRDFGAEFDFNKPFFEQFHELFKKVPLPSSKVINSTNSEYNQSVVNSKDCYRSSRVEDGENLYYCYLALKSCKDCFDCFDIMNCELCYECIKCERCYECQYAELSEGSHDLIACYDMRGCRSCIGCVSLRSKEHYVLNKPCSKNEFLETKKQFEHSSAFRKEFWRHYHALNSKTPRRATWVLRSENCRGEYIKNSKNCYMCFDIAELEDCAFQIGSEFSKDSIDGEFVYKSERNYDCLAPYSIHESVFSMDLADGSDQLYSAFCMANCRNLFGCVSLKKKQYCILNRQYSKDDYEALLPQIISHMEKTKEWGEFFPMALSPIPYNESLAQFYQPLSREEAQTRGLWWAEPEETQDQSPSTLSGEKVPFSVEELPEQAIISCEVTKKPFLLLPQELEFYRTSSIPVPRRHPDLRHLRRFESLNLFELHTRRCAKTGVEIETSYPPDSDAVVYANQVHIEEFQ